VIKVNLLESVTDRPASVAFVEDKVSSTRTQTFLLALTVVALLVLGIGYDYVSEMLSIRQQPRNSKNNVASTTR